MNNPDLYCITGTSICRSMAEWGVNWQAITAIFTVAAGIFGLWKIYHELQRLFTQNANEIIDKKVAAKLKRTEFFLNQHRRLFDNPELYSILCLIDGDDISLTIGNEMADKKRKFLTFFEEIALLVKSDQIEKDVAYYMFGYYAICALTGKNFASGIDTSKKYWGLLYDFAAESKKFLDKHQDGPPSNISL